MDAPKFVTHRGASILLLDYAGASAAQLAALLEEAEQIIRKQPPRSLLILTRMYGYEFASESTKLLLEHIDGNGPHARASAVVGMGHLAPVIPIANRMSGRDLEPFDDEVAALDWLASRGAAGGDDTNEPVRFVARDGCRILRIDFRGASGAELLSRVNVAAATIQSQQERSVLTLTLVNGIAYDKVVTAAIKEYVRANRPYVLAGAVVGLDYLRQIILPLNRLTGRNLRAFDDEGSAGAWLSAEWSRHGRN
ncbi:MAG: hypothetical protein WC538_16415 [Thermoanaerobaculia bacterium]|jgi:hypothetical protein